MIQQTIGQQLSGARESIRASLYQASQDTKIRVDFLECLEDDDFEFVSGRMYVRGMLRSYTRWLGLDEASVLRDFDHGHDPQADSAVAALISTPAQVGPRQRRPHWLLAASGAAVILLFLSLVGLMDSGNNVATLPPNPVESQSKAGVAVADPASPDTLAQAPVTPMAGVNVMLTVTGAKAWVRVQVDGGDKPQFEGILNKGQSQMFSGSDRVKVLIGDLGAVTLTLNGKELGVPGLSGQVATREFTKDSVALSAG